MKKLTLAAAVASATMLMACGGSSGSTGHTSVEGSKLLSPIEASPATRADSYMQFIADANKVDLGSELQSDLVDMRSKEQTAHFMAWHINQEHSKQGRNPVANSLKLDMGEIDDNFHAAIPLALKVQGANDESESERLSAAESLNALGQQIANSRILSMSMDDTITGLDSLKRQSITLVPSLSGLTSALHSRFGFTNYTWHDDAKQEMSSERFGVPEVDAYYYDDTNQLVHMRGALALHNGIAIYSHHVVNPSNDAENQYWCERVTYAEESSDVEGPQQSKYMTINVKRSKVNPVLNVDDCVTDTAKLAFVEDYRYLVNDTYDYVLSDVNYSNGSTMTAEINDKGQTVKSHYSLAPTERKLLNIAWFHLPLDEGQDVEQLDVTLKHTWYGINQKHDNRTTQYNSASGVYGLTVTNGGMTLRRTFSDREANIHNSPHLRGLEDYGSSFLDKIKDGYIEVVEFESSNNPKFKVGAKLGEITEKREDGTLVNAGYSKLAWWANAYVNAYSDGKINVPFDKWADNGITPSTAHKAVFAGTQINNSWVSNNPDSDYGNSAAAAIFGKDAVLAQVHYPIENSALLNKGFESEDIGIKIDNSYELDYKELAMFSQSFITSQNTNLTMANTAKPTEEFSSNARAAEQAFAGFPSIYGAINNGSQLNYYYSKDVELKSLVMIPNALNMASVAWGYGFTAPSHTGNGTEICTKEEGKENPQFGSNCFQWFQLRGSSMSTTYHADAMFDVVKATYTNENHNLKKFPPIWAAF